MKLLTSELKKSRERLTRGALNTLYEYYFGKAPPPSGEVDEALMWLEVLTHISPQVDDFLGPKPIRKETKMGLGLTVVAGVLLMAAKKEEMVRDIVTIQSANMHSWMMRRDEPIFHDPFVMPPPPWWKFWRRR